MRLSDNGADKRYRDFSDEELLADIESDRRGITEYLVKKYRALAAKKARSMFILGGDDDDLIQNGMIGLYNAVLDYDPGRDVNFRSFADLCITRQVYTAVTAAKRKKHSPLNESISLDSDIDSEDGQGVVWADMLSDNTGNNPEDMVIARENVDHIMGLIESQLSEFERQALELYMTGMNYTEIAKVLGKDPKSTDNALSRAKLKLKKALQ